MKKLYAFIEFLDILNFFNFLKVFIIHNYFKFINK